MCCHPSLSGINTDNNGLAEPATRLFNQPGVFHRGCAQDNALDASFKQLLYCFQPADATTQLGRY